MSDNEMDAELLALAEGDSSEEEGEYDATQHIEEDARSPTPDVKPSVEKVEDNGVKRGVAQKVRAKRGRRARRRDDSEDEEDDGLASPDSFLDELRRSESADAPGSPMSNDEDEAPLYPIEGKYMSASDREWLTSLPELEREQELDRRAQEVIRKQQDKQLKRALANNKATKRKADEAELEEANRKSTRPKVERGAKTALDKYKKAREQAGAERERRDGRKPTRRDERSPSEDSQRDADGESEVEWAEPDRRREERGPEVADFERCRVGRSNFARICFDPGFEEAITGCYVRLSVGPNRETGENIYRMALIKGFRESKPYNLEGAHGKKVFTDQYVILAQGKSERHWPFAACSDGKFSAAELGRYLDALKEQRLRLPTRKTLDAKVDDINKLLNKVWTDEDISKKIAKQKGIQAKHDPANAAKLAREKILKRKEIAEAEDDFDELARCNAELLALESNGTAKPIVQARQKPGALSEQDRLKALNDQNREANRREIRNAQLKERQRDIAADQRRIAAKKAAEAKLKVPDELFGESDVSRAGTPSAAKRISRATTPVKQPLGHLRSVHKTEDDVIGSMDMDIDIEI